jgi:hypothetical protein
VSAPNTVSSAGTTDATKRTIAVVLGAIGLVAIYGGFSTASNQYQSFGNALATGFGGGSSLVSLVASQPTFLFGVAALAVAVFLLVSKRRAPSPTASSAPAGWFADQSRRHELRYWDGAKWTEHVSDAGVQAIDPA